MKSEYQNAIFRVGENNIDISGNEVESVPSVISRNGLTLRSSVISLTFLYSYVAESFADPLNTEKPSATGSVGVVPSYGILDINTSISISNSIKVKLNLNNALDKNYFTKRPAFYPGPGVWASDGRSFTCSVGFTL